MNTSKGLINKVMIAVIAITICFTSMISVNAADASTNYSAYPTPSTSSDYAYWNGSKVVRAAGTTISEVKWMQASLNYCIVNKGVSASKLALDGSFGPACKKATLAFQKKYGLSQDGSFGPKTITKMISILPKTTATTTTKSSTATVSSKSKTLNINWTTINGTGTQSVSGPCGCYALAYCRDILDNKPHSWTEFSENDKPQWNSYKGGPWEYRYSYSVVWSKGKYYSKSFNSAQSTYKAIYDSINAGKPVALNVKGRGSKGHYIAVVGYTNVQNVNSLTTNNFLIIDSAKSGKKSGTENMGSVGYSLLQNKIWVG